MKFNKSLDWLKESDDDELLGNDELDLAKPDEEQINEVRYIDPSNVDKYDPSEIEEVTTASGEKRYKRKSGTTSNQTVDKKDLHQEPTLSTEEQEFIANNKARNSEVEFFMHPEYGILMHEPGEPYEDMHGLFYSDTDSKHTKLNTNDLTKLNTQSIVSDVSSFSGIPDRNNVDWKNINANDKHIYDINNLVLFSKKKPHDSTAYSIAKHLIDSNLDGAAISWMKDHLKETPEIAKALKKFDNALQEKDLQKSWQAYQNLWDVHRNATKRKYNKKS